MSAMTSSHGFDLDDLRVFTAVARSGSFTAAAEALNYTQSGVSRRIAQLERSAGAALFVRMARGVRLTGAGRMLLRHATQILDHADVVAGEFDAIRAGTGGRLSVGAFATANAALAPVTLHTLSRERPELKMTVREDWSPNLLTAVRTGVLDIAVVSDYLSGTISDDGVRLVHLLDDPLFVALPLGHTLAGHDEVHLADLADEIWVDVRAQQDSGMLAAAAARAGFQPRQDITVASWTGKQSYVAAGLGVMLVPWLLMSALRSDLAVRPVADELGPRRVFAALPTVVTPAAARCLELLHETVVNLAA
jgi:DNA-binding transcriptional LysR family regulator